VGRTRYVRSGETRIGYELRGRLRRRRPWLVLIQGMGLDRRGWEGIPGKLRRRFRLVLMDNRGCGRSERPAGSFTVADMAGMSSRCSTRPASGRRTCWAPAWAAWWPRSWRSGTRERVDALVLACTTPGWPFAYPMPGRCRRRPPPERGTPDGSGRPASGLARWSCTAARTRSSTRATAGCSPAASPGPSSGSSPSLATCSSGKSRMASPQR